MAPPQISIFLASPNDLVDERKAFAEVVGVELAALFAGQADIALTLWEDTPAAWLQSIQSRLHPERHTIVVVMFWSKMGSAAPIAHNIGQLSGERVTRTEWEFEAAAKAALDDLAAGHDPPQPMLLLYRKSVASIPRLSRGAGEARQRADIDAVEDFFERWVGDGWRRIAALAGNAGVACILADDRTRHSFADVRDFRTKVREHLEAAIADLIDAQALPAVPIITESPFRPLEPFDYRDDARIFCGRDGARASLREMVRAGTEIGRPFFVVSGPSGVGKSSLVRCGLLHDLRIYGTFGLAPLRHAVVDLFADPVLPAMQLAAALLAPDGFGAECTQLGLDAAVLAERLAPGGARAVIHDLAHLAGGDGVPARLVLVLDQFEAMLEPGLDAAARDEGLARIAALAASGQVAIVATSRSDRERPLPGVLDPWFDATRNVLSLGFPSVSQLREMIAEPLRLAGIRVEADAHGSVVDRIVDAVHPSPECLPLVEVALDGLYRQAREAGRELTFAMYEAAGGIEGAIRRHAERVEAEAAAKLPGTDIAGAFDDLLFDLVRMEVREETVERMAWLEAGPDVPEGHWQLLAHLASRSARLLVSEARPEGARFRLSHESLLRQWPLLRDKIETLRPRIELLHRLGADARAWRAAPDAGRLITSPLRLREAEELLAHLPERRRRASGLDDFVGTSRTEQARQVAAEQALRRQVAEEFGRLRAARIETLGGNRDYVAAMAVLEEAIATVRELAAVPPGALIRAANSVQMADPLIARLDGRKGSVWSLAVLPDGRLASGGADGTIRLWDPARGVETAQLEGRTGSVQSLAVLPDGQLASGVSDGTISLWDPVLGVETAQLKGHMGSVQSLAVLPDGRLASGGSDSMIRLWDRARGVETARLEGHFGGVLSLAVLPDGRLASAGDYGTVRLWDPARGVETAQLDGHTGGVPSLAVLPDGRLAWGGNRGTILLWDPARGVETAWLEPHMGSLPSLEVLPDGRLALGGDDGTIWLWHPARGVETARLVGHTGAVWSLAVLPDGRLASGSDDRTIRLWQPKCGVETARLEGHKGGVLSVAVLADGRLASGDSDRTIRLWDPTRGAETARLEGHRGWVLGLAVLPDGRLASGGSDRTIRLWDSTRGIETALLARHTDFVLSFAVLPDGRLASGGTDGTICLWDPARGVETARLEGGHTGAVWALAVLPDGRLASAGDDGMICLWDPTRGVETARLEGHTGSVRSLAVLADGHLVSGAFDSTIRLWDPARGVEAARLEGHTGSVLSLAVLPDGRLASGSEDGTIRLWDPARGVETSRLEGHRGRVLSMAMLPDRRLASGDGDGTIRLWAVGELTTDIAVAWSRLAAVDVLSPALRLSLDIPPILLHPPPATPVPPDLPSERDAPLSDLLHFYALIVRCAEAAGDDDKAACHRIRRGSLARLLPRTELPTILARIDADWARMLAAPRLEAPHGSDTAG